jgi:Rrf2 family iron-sulfur cluster assembly transcriptional regulator
MTIPTPILDALALADVSWRPLLIKGLEAMMKATPAYLPDLAQDDYLPTEQRLFAAFALPLEKVRYVLVGEGPYPRAEARPASASWTAPSAACGRARGRRTVQAGQQSHLAAQFHENAAGGRMRLTTKGRFAVTAMIDLALRQDKGPVTLSGISQRQEISLSYLEQLFGKLRRHEIVESMRGPGGGYTWRAAPERSPWPTSSLPSTSRWTRPSAAARKIATAPTMPAARCMTHDLWATLNAKMVDYLDSVSLQDLVDQQKQKNAEQNVVVMHRPHAAAWLKRINNGVKDECPLTKSLIDTMKAPRISRSTWTTRPPRRSIRAWPTR